jgi:hypothetical protein
MCIISVDGEAVRIVGEDQRWKMAVLVACRQLTGRGGDGLSRGRGVRRNCSGKLRGR